MNDDKLKKNQIESEATSTSGKKKYNGLAIKSQDIATASLGPTCNGMAAGSRKASRPCTILLS